jgi:hypothetical protein
MLVPIYERGWNRISGWFTLAHVCQKWRRVVLASTSRLDLSLVIIAENPGCMKTVLTPRLPPLPIRIDYEYGTLMYNDIGRMDAALKHRDRVRGIVFKGADEHLEIIFKAMKFPFPALDRLEIYHSCGDLKLPPTFLRGSAPRLRRIILSPVLLASISRLLSSATALVELSLNIDTIIGPSPAESLVAYLQAMPCLRWFALTLRKGYSLAKIKAHPMKGETVVSLPRLTFLHFSGRQAFLDALLARLAAPSLQAFDIELLDNNMPPFCHLGRFITDIEAEYHAFRLVSLSEGSFCLSLVTLSECLEDPNPHFRFYSRDIMQIAYALSPKLAAVEELLLDYPDKPWASTPWRSFLELFCSIKILRLHRRIAVNIGHSLPQKLGEPEAVLPSLEEIELRSNFRSHVAEDQRRSDLAAFEPFLVTRQQAGIPVKIFWSEVHCYSRCKLYLDYLNRISEWAFMFWCDSSLRSPGF